MAIEEPMAETPHLLLVDDERSIREPLAKYLEKQGFRVTQAGDAEAARTRLAAYAIDLVVLDIMMPGEDGLSLTRHIRETGDVPVILLTARSEETDRIVGLEMGADDYVVKPFSPRELAARIKVILRRAASRIDTDAQGRVTHVTHTAKESDLRATVAALENVDVVNRVGSVLRVVGEEQ